MHPTIKKQIQSEVANLLGNLSTLFSNNELAYYSLQGKNELQIRDKVAYQLQQRLDSHFGEHKYIVRREWGIDSRIKFDLAVLGVDAKNNNKVELVALLEFKAQEIVDKETWTYGAFYVDVKKMYDTIKRYASTGAGNKDVVVTDEVDMYFIFLHSMQNQNQKTGGFGQAVAYKQLLNSKNARLSNNPNNDKSVISFVRNYWGDFYINQAINNEIFTKSGTIGAHYNSKIPAGTKSVAINYTPPSTHILSPVFQSVGKYLGYEWFVAPMIWGPYTCKNIQVI